MTQEHPITPPAELVQQWVDNLAPEGMLSFATQAARWGADTELEACCADIHTLYGKCRADWLRAHRRPKPPSLKEQALGALYAIATGADDTREFYQDLETIKQALESLPS